jgi:hypothetical protein
MIEAPFAYQEGDAGIHQNSREVLVNMYAEVENSGRSKLVRRQRPGLKRLFTQYGIKRGIAEFTHGTFIAIRDKVYKIDGAGLIELGSLTTNIGPVTFITDDNDNVFISDNTSAFHYNSTTEAYDPVTTPTATGTCDFQGGFGIYAVPDADQWYISATNDLTSWDALDFATAESSPDKIVRVFVDHGEILFFGSKSIESWRNTGAQDFPFAFNTAIERGCAAAMSVAADDNSVFWLGNDYIVYRMDGYRPSRVSTHAIEEWIKGAPDKSTGRSFIYTERGHKFYVLTFPGYGTRQFNIATNFWNLCRTWGFEEWDILGGNGRPTTYYATAVDVGTLDSSINTDSGGIMERGGVSAPVANGVELITMSSFMVDAVVGRVAEGASDPQIMLRVSKNGEEFGNIKTRGLGETGNYRRRAVWRNFGQAREFVVEMLCTDDVNLTIMSTYADVA